MIPLISALRASAKKLREKPEEYQWNSLGKCNCGTLIQSVTNLQPSEISKAGIRKHGDWNNISLLYRKDSPYQVDDIITRMLSIGMTIEDFTYLENLSDPKVLSFMKEVSLSRDNPLDAARYMEAWADLLEQNILKEEVAELADARM
jgi:hypothetical protein